MTNLDYAKTLRNGAQVLIDNPDSCWWYYSVVEPTNVFNWLLRLEGLSTKPQPLDFLTNEEAALCFLFLAEALEAGDL